MTDGIRFELVEELLFAKILVRPKIKQTNICVFIIEFFFIFLSIFKTPKVSVFYFGILLNLFTILTLTRI